MARKFDAQRAFELYQNHESTRLRENLQNVDSEHDNLKKELESAKFTVLPGRDKYGAAIALFTARLHFPTQTTHQQVLKALVYQLDAALESLDTQRHGIVFIYDMTDSKYSNFDYDLSKKILNMLKGGYPARLKKVLIVTAPLWFKAPFKILRLFVREKLQERVYIINLSQISLHIPQESIPKQLGGACPSKHTAWLQVCKGVAQGQSPNMDTYFLACKRRQSQTSADMTSVTSQRSLSSDISDNLLISDLESEDSKETVNEKYSCEDLEKEEEIGIEKEVIVEKETDDLSANGTVKRRRDSDGKSNNVKHLTDGKIHENSVQNGENDQETPRKKRPSSAVSNDIYEESIHMPDDGGIELDQLVQCVKAAKRRGLYEEYAQIKMEQPVGTFTVSRAKYNLPKNRYADVLSLDQTRVKLPTVEGDPSSDYINANFVDGYMQKNAYISTQGPLPKTFGDFWRMIWYCQVMVVVMTTRTVERGRQKCGQYWPPEEDGEEQFDEFIVINTGMEQSQDYTITGLFLHNTKTGESRQVYHLQFTSWPDYGVPRTASAFLDFLFRVRSCQVEATKSLGSSWQGHSNGPPMVVHCSAGIGRTGTFITIDISLQRLEHIGNIDVSETVRRIRSQRAFSIQMPDQFVFCHFAIIEHGMREGKIGEIDWEGFDDSDSDED
ncbi:hypothetical protein FSP39_002853 [Pinctada imbricata]|uniref:Tyrosine-protein phosphatase non-receptor type 9 n=1 Tax=Pinctada imbricata TaxID=66713 RepID=A0AA88Y8R1_PINIB|nr:hypothetical protein FSP39_002853 [Pinctada imbricata]